VFNPKTPSLRTHLTVWLSLLNAKQSVLGTPVTSFDLRNETPLFTELRLLQGTLSAKVSTTFASHTRLLPL